MKKHPISPFVGEAPKEIPLPKAPLVRVVAQIRFPRLLALRSDLTVAPFQEKIRGRYPALVEEKIHAFQFPVGMPLESHEVKIWRFSDMGDTWRVSLGPDFMALESMKYTSRTDFIDRLAEVVDALATTVDPKYALRIGVRYVSRVVSPEISNIGKMIIPEVLGVGGVAAFREAQSVLVTEAILKVTEGESRVRYGFMPINATHEPEVMPPVNEASWMCDVDTSVDGSMEFSKAVLKPLSLSLSVRCYSVFRALVTDEFLSSYGGKL